MFTIEKELPNELDKIVNQNIEEFIELPAIDRFTLLKKVDELFLEEYISILKEDETSPFFETIDIKKTFYQKYLLYYKLCKEYLDKRESISGYNIDDIVKIKVKELCQNVINQFPHGWG